MRLAVAAETFPLARAFTISRGSRTEAQVLTVTIDDGGVRGRGECVPYARYGETLDERRAPRSRACRERFDRAALQALLPPGAARNAVDCALWDLEAKRSGRRVWQLAGLARPGREITAYTLSLDTPEAMRAEAARHAHRPLLKIKLGGEGDIARLEAVRARRARRRGSSSTPTRAGPPTPTPPSPRRWCALGVELVEQPLPAGAGRGAGRDGAAAAGLRRRELPRPRRASPGLRGSYDMVNIKLDKTGGLTEALALRDAAAGGGLRHHGRLHGRLVAGDGAGGADGAGRATSSTSTARCCWRRDRAHPLRYDDRGVHPPRRRSSGDDMSRIVYVNGDYLPEEEAKISVFDRGFLFADAVYEVTSVLDGRLVDFAGHLARLHRSLGQIEMPAPRRRRRASRRSTAS